MSVNVGQNHLSTKKNAIFLTRLDFYDWKSRILMARLHFSDWKNEKCPHNSHFPDEKNRSVWIFLSFSSYNR